MTWRRDNGPAAGHLCSSWISVVPIPKCSPSNGPSVVADSGYVSQAFLAAFVGVFTVVVLLRLRSNQVLYGPPVPRRPKGHPFEGVQRGRTPKHGRNGPAAGHLYTLKQMPTPDREQRCQMGRHTIILQAWTGLHLKSVAALVGMVVCVTVLNDQGTPKFKRPLWLFKWPFEGPWTGATTLDLHDIARMYLWRFCIEHFFRFMKQHLGLCACNATSLQAVTQWMRLCLLAYWQLLVSADLAHPPSVPWRKIQPAAMLYSLSFSPRQVQKWPFEGPSAFPEILHGIGTPAQPPRPAGKAPGRAPGSPFTPKPRPAIIYKSKKAAAVSSRAT